MSNGQMVYIIINIVLININLKITMQEKGKQSIYNSEQCLQYIVRKSKPSLIIDRIPSTQGKINVK